MPHPKDDHLPDTTMWSSIDLRIDSSTTLPTGIVPRINVIFITTVRDDASTYYKSFHDDLFSYMGIVASQK